RPLIALVLPSLGIGGGAEAANATLARELVRSGFRVEFVVGRHDEPRCILADSAGYVLLNASKTRRLLRPPARYLKRRQPVAVIASMWPLTVVAALAHRCARSKARLVVWEHNRISSQYAGLGLFHQLLLKWSVVLTYPLADVRVAVSRGVADDIAALSGI